MTKKPGAAVLVPLTAGFLHGGMVIVETPSRAVKKQATGAVASFAWGPNSGDLAGWQVKGILVADADGVLNIHELTIQPRDLSPVSPAGGVSTSVLRAIPLGRLLNAVRSAMIAGPEQVASWEATTGESFTTLKKQAERAAKVAKGAALKRGRKGYPDDHYRWVAHEYLSLQAAGWSKGILVELAHRAEKHLGRDFVARETVRDWVHEARNRQFLTKATQGRAGASPGPNLYTTTKKKGKKP